MKAKSHLRSIPSVEKLLQALGDVDLPRPALLAVVRRELALLRRQKEVHKFDEVVAQTRAALQELRARRIQPVLNGTGIVIHTNLGRAPLGSAVLETLREIGANYCNLEYDLAAGERGERAAYLEHNLALLCGADAATVTNNCAAALVLILRHFTADKRKEVVISRGELVQIGGGFRIPDILEASGARLREVGTTNKTTLNDYSKAIRKETALILKVHRSNFFMGGFVESPTTEEIAALAAKKRLPFVEDLGSGAVISTEKIAEIEHEPTPAEILKRGVDLVTFSGDKLLGGPQAGIIAGQAKMVAALKREPFFRALRCDKLILAALQTTIDLYLAGAPENAAPVLAMLQIAPEELQARAKQIIAQLEGLPIKAELGEGKTQVGGGTLPQSTVRSVTVDLFPKEISLKDLASGLRMGRPPLIGYIAGNRFKIDLRTIRPAQDDDIVRAVRAFFELRSPRVQ